MIFWVTVGAILRAKSEPKQRILDLVQELKNVKFLRVDDTGENFALEKLCKQQNVDVKFEFSGPRTTKKWKGTFYN
jgi:hypothetical protein